MRSWEPDDDQILGDAMSLLGTMVKIVVVLFALIGLAEVLVR